ncbi:hypothetical protein LTS10_012994 [Elasticomyces elasticus]|nr:hypothetical protein LTS10_012994 [Elasticomyces elasticus]
MSDSSDDEIVVKIKTEEDDDDCIVVATDKRKRVLSIASDLTPSTSTPTQRPKRHRKAHHAASSSSAPTTTLAVGVPERSSEGRRPYTVLSYALAPTPDEDSDNVTSCVSCTESTPTQPAKLCGRHHQAYLERERGSINDILAPIAAIRQSLGQVKADIEHRAVTRANLPAKRTQLVPDGNTPGITSSSSPTSTPSQQSKQPRQTPSVSSSNTPVSAFSNDAPDHSCEGQRVHAVLHHAETSNPSDPQTAPTRVGFTLPSVLASVDAANAKAKAFESNDHQRPATKPEAALLGVFGSVGAANTKACQFADTRLADEIEDGFDDVSDPYKRVSARESLGYGCHGTRSFAIDGRIRFCVNSFTTGPKTLSVQEHILEDLHRAVPQATAAADPRRLPSATAVTSAETTDEFSQPDKQVYAVLYHVVGTTQTHRPGMAYPAVEPEAMTVGIYGSLGAANSRAGRFANENALSYQKFEDVDDPEETVVPEKLDFPTCTRSHAADGRLRFCLNSYSHGPQTVAVTRYIVREDAPNQRSGPRYEFAVLHRLIREEEPSSEMIENFSFEEIDVYQSLEEANKVALDLSVRHHAGVTREPDRWPHNPLSLWPCPDEADIRISSCGRNGEMRYVFWQLDRVQPPQSSCAWYVVERRRLL